MSIVDESVVFIVMHHRASLRFQMDVIKIGGIFKAKLIESLAVDWPGNDRLCIPEWQNLTRKLSCIITHSESMTCIRWVDS